MSRGRVEDEKPKKLAFGLDRVCTNCKGKGYKNKHECWACHGTKIQREERKSE